MEKVSLQSSSSSSTTDEEFSSSIQVQDDHHHHRTERFLGVEKLREGDRCYKMVEKLFLDGMRSRSVDVDFDVAVASVQRCCSTGSRSKLFKAMADMTGEARGGDANVRFAWYGAPADGVAEAIRHGFGKANGGGLGSGAHGLGVHLSPPRSPYGSEDTNSYKFLLGIKDGATNLFHPELN